MPMSASIVPIGIVIQWSMTDALLHKRHPFISLIHSHKLLVVYLPPASLKLPLAVCCVAATFYSKPHQIQQPWQSSWPYSGIKAVMIFKRSASSLPPLVHYCDQNELPSCLRGTEVCLCKESSRLQFSSGDEVFGLKSNQKRLSESRRTSNI